ncbi:hypothetical protein LP414_12975 [Polaromonas sp. P1(28)-13]|nr:hypothetical protein LP414_12975 [Polaromonas sp. P1(28)-13]
MNEPFDFSSNANFGERLDQNRRRILRLAVGLYGVVQFFSKLISHHSACCMGFLKAHTKQAGNAYRLVRVAAAPRLYVLPEILATAFAPFGAVASKHNAAICKACVALQSQTRHQPNQRPE